MTEQELTLSQALTFAKVAELPAKVEIGNNEWTKAIVLVKKANNRINYAVAHNDGMGHPQIVADFGGLFRIKEILEIHPYSNRSKIFEPVFKSKDEILTYLVNHGEDRKKIEELMADVHKNKKAKSAARKEEDNAKIKALIAKYTIKDQNEVKNARERDYNNAFSDKFLPKAEPSKPEVEPIDIEVNGEGEEF